MPEPSRLTDAEVRQLGAALRTFESKFLGIGPRGDTAVAPTGEPYSIVTHDGLQREGECSLVGGVLKGARVPGFSCHLSASSAIEMWLENALKMVMPQSYLYWRCQPDVGLIWREIESNGMTIRLQAWSVYSRFLISSIPPK